jgi:hypothetical protein
MLGKIALLTQIDASNLGGIVLKPLAAITSREDTKSVQIYKFTRVSSFLVIKRNQKASVDLGAIRRSSPLN